MSLSYNIMLTFNLVSTGMERTIIGIDPGTAITGYGILQAKHPHLTVLEYGVIRTPKEDTPSQRLTILYKKLTQLLTKYKPDVAGCEQLFFSKNVKTATTVAQARGVILLALAQANIPMIEFTPPQLKLAITGHGKADKQQIQYMTQQILQLTEPAQPDDAADALALAIAAAHATAQAH